jgi:hypothetical protein
MLAPQNPLASGSPADYWDLFQPGAVWSKAAKINEFGVSARLITDSPDDKLRQAFQYLKAHNIKLRIGILSLKGSNDPNGPGHGVEGFAANPPGEALLVAKRVKSLGGVVDFVDLDEPLWYGHYYSEKNAIHAPIADLARQAGATIRAVRTIFPSAKYGEAEPVQGIPDAVWRSDMQEWFSALQAAAGQPLSSFFIDIQWDLPMRQRISGVIDLLAKSKIGCGIIFNGYGAAGSDATWVRSGEEHIQVYNSLFARSPIVVSISSWNPNPTRILPSSSPTALTHLVDYHFSPAATQPAPLPFRQMVKAGCGYFYSADPAEIKAHEAKGWKLDTGVNPNPPYTNDIAGGIYRSRQSAIALVPLYRFYLSSRHKYAYAATASGQSMLLTSGYTRDAVAGYVFPSEDSGGIPFHRFFDSPSGSYIYATNPVVCAKLAKAGCLDQGVECYLPPGWVP